MNQFREGETLVCSECGVELTVTRDCECGGECEIICCGKPLQPKEKPSGGCCCCS